MKRVLQILPLSLILFSCGPKDCYDCTYTFSEITTISQNTVIQGSSSWTEEFCGSKEEMEIYEDQNSWKSDNTMQGVACVSNQ